MSLIDCDACDAESLEELLEPTVEVPMALLLASSCCGCGVGAPRGGHPRSGC